ncbi:hypothetical protein FA13DRAFT_1235603 [Coprinellus micaceus]|uniref:Uncharacterized protein n=1 Tax=Coprinellus micaceus TaxID=71717 RepID=A0A4Y7TQI7_COPMI|nr:hypothetical protein FA13DRAFT_1235603 [Coprinellus micaceus]
MTRPLAETNTRKHALGTPSRQPPWRRSRAVKVRQIDYRPGQRKRKPGGVRAPTPPCSRILDSWSTMMALPRQRARQTTTTRAFALVPLPSPRSPTYPLQLNSDRLLHKLLSFVSILRWLYVRCGRPPLFVGVGLFISYPESG